MGSISLAQNQDKIQKCMLPYPRILMDSHIIIRYLFSKSGQHIPQAYLREVPGSNLSIPYLGIMKLQEILHFRHHGDCMHK